MSYFESEDLQTKLEGEVLWITLSRPEAMNAFTDEMIKGFIGALKKAEQDPKVRLSVITGEGKAFCAGGDIKAMEEKTGMFAGDSKELAERYQKGIQQIPKTIEACHKPIIAMVNGAAIGAGLDLACMCDIRVGSPYSKFGETFSKLALVPGDGGSYFLQRIVGFAKAMEMTLTAKVYSSEEALNMGLLNELVESDQLKSAVQKYIDAILLTAPRASAMGKEALKMAYHESLDPMLDKLAAFQGETQRTEDHFEALAAFKEKRKPVWKGQ